MAASRPQEFTQFVWRVMPQGVPSAQRHCARCNGVRAFVPTRNFRVNAQQKRIDVWLIYRCRVCDETWNRPILERASVSGIGAERLERLERNDPDLALDYAFDVEDLRNRGITVDAHIPFTLQAERIAIGDGAAALVITLALARPIGTRLDRLLGTGLGVARSCIVSWWRSGALHVAPHHSNALQRAPHDGQMIVIEGEATVSARRQMQNVSFDGARDGPRERTREPP